VRVAAIQINSTSDKSRNLEIVDRYCSDAVSAGAELIVLPEKWTVLGTDQEIIEGAEDVNGPAISWAKAFAKQHGIELVAGSISERSDSSELPFNTSFHISPEGEILAYYRKLHMFDVEVEGSTYSESDSQTAGSEIVTSEGQLGLKLGLSICYDLRFPELYRAQRLLGADMFAVPAAFTLVTTRAHWQTLTRARAIENQCFMVAANQTGSYAEGLVSGGCSTIVDPWGKQLATADEESECFISAELDTEKLYKLREDFPLFKQRRTDIYRLNWE